MLRTRVPEPVALAIEVCGDGRGEPLAVAEPGAQVLVLRVLPSSGNHLARPKAAAQLLQEEIEVGDDEKLFISSYVKKEKVSGKDSFVVYYDSFPNTYDFEKEAVYLKIYVFLLL